MAEDWSNGTLPRLGDVGDAGSPAGLAAARPSLTLSSAGSSVDIEALARSCATLGLPGEEANLTTARAKPMRRILSVSSLPSLLALRAARAVTRGYLYKLTDPERHESVCWPCGSSRTVKVSPLTVTTTGSRVRAVVENLFTSTTVLRIGAIFGADMYVYGLDRAAPHACRLTKSEQSRTATMMSERKFGN